MGRRHGRAGASAQRRYEEGLRRWRAKVRGSVALVVAPLIVAGGACALAGHGPWDFYGGALVGMGLAMAMWAWDTPPAYVEHWKQGADGERRTARRLRDLEDEGWVVFHDVDGARGNRDHIVVGPAGLFLIDSKALFGDVEIDDDHVVCHRMEGRFSYRTNLGAPLRGAAAALYRELRTVTPGAVYVQAVAAIWARFPDGLVEGDRVVFVHGDRLTDWLRRQPHRLADHRVTELVAALQLLAAPRAA